MKTLSRHSISAQLLHTTAHSPYTLPTHTHSSPLTTTAATEHSSAPPLHATRLASSPLSALCTRQALLNPAIAPSRGSRPSGRLTNTHLPPTTHHPHGLHIFPMRTGRLRNSARRTPLPWVPLGGFDGRLIKNSKLQANMEFVAGVARVSVV